MFTLDNDGHFIILDLDITNLFKITLVNIYAPNIDDISWYNQLLDNISKKRENSLIMVGDWNTPLSKMDKYNYNSVRHPHCRNSINEFMVKESLVDLWRLTNKSIRGFTWRSQNPCCRSRLDYSLISDDILVLDPNIEYIPAY